MGLFSARLIPDDIERYQQHRYVEVLKRYEHLKRLGLEKLIGISAEDELLLRIKREEYIERWGGNTTRWSGNSLESDVRLVDRTYRPACNEEHFYEYLYCQVYRTGSQTVHGSFAGLAKIADIENIDISGLNVSQFKANEKHLIFSCFHSMLVFLSSMRFLGHLTGSAAVEDYFHKIANYVISEK